MTATGNMQSKQPTRDDPHRAIAADVKTRRVHGTYQCVVDLPAHPTKADLYDAFEASGLELCTLAAKWRDDEARSGKVSVDGPTASYRVVFDMRLIPEEKRGPRV